MALSVRENSSSFNGGLLGLYGKYGQKLKFEHLERGSYHQI